MRNQTITPDRVPLANGSGSGSGSSSSLKLPLLAPRPSTDAPAVVADTSRLESIFAATSLEQPKSLGCALHPALASTPATLAIWSPARDHGYQSSSHLANRIVQNVASGSAAADGSLRLQWENKGPRGRRDPTPLLPTTAPTPALATPAQARRRDTSPLLATPVTETPAEARRRASLKIKQRAAAAAASAAASAQVPAEKLMPPPSACGGENHRSVLLSLPPHPVAVATTDALKGRAILPKQQRSTEETRAVAGTKQQPTAVARGEKQPQQQQNRRQRQVSEKEKGKAPAIPESPKRQRQAPSEMEKGKAPAIPESPRRQPQQQQPAFELHKLMAAARLEIPRISTQLTRKEKEEDWLLMTGTKLPVRPKKRTKPVEKNVSMICPGQYLGDVTRARYMVREKKSRKEKRKGGLKAMDSDSD